MLVLMCAKKTHETAVLCKVFTDMEGQVIWDVTESPVMVHDTHTRWRRRIVTIGLQHTI